MSHQMHAVVHLAGGITECLEAHPCTTAIYASHPTAKTLPGTIINRAPQSEPAADKPSETKAFPQPSSAPFSCQTAAGYLSGGHND